jgi:uncharacterized protein YijF (DUF1287 family)
MKPMWRVLVQFVLVSALALPLAADPRVIAGAKQQVGITRGYDSAYRQIAYPGGDVPREVGVCTDVIVRAYRHAGTDLQVLVHQDMKDNFGAYPKQWGLRRPDPNIDHRRVPNLATFFTRRGGKLPVTRRGSDYKPGDIITWRLSSGVPHIGLVSDVPARGTDRYLVVHNIGGGAQIEDVLFAYELTGHYRWELPR